MPKPYETIKIRCIGPNGEAGFGLVTEDQIRDGRSWSADVDGPGGQALVDIGGCGRQSDDSVPHWMLVSHGGPPDLEDFGAGAVNRAASARVLTAVQAQRWFRQRGYTLPESLNRQLDEFPDLESRVRKSYRAAAQIIDSMAARHDLPSLTDDTDLIPDLQESLWFIEAARFVDSPLLPYRGDVPGRRHPRERLWLEAVRMASSSLLSDLRSLKERSGLLDPEAESKLHELLEEGVRGCWQRFRSVNANRLKSLLLSEEKHVLRALIGSASAKAAPIARAEDPATSEGLGRPILARARLDQGVWHISFGSDSCTINAVKGIRYIVELIHKQGQTLTAQELHALGRHLNADRSKATSGTDSLEFGIHISRSSAGGPDAAEVGHLQDLRDDWSRSEAEIDRAKRAGDTVLIQELTKGQAIVAGEIARAGGVLQGSRTKASDSARKAVRRAVDVALSKFATRLPQLHTHMERFLDRKNGYSYRPNPFVEWTL